MTPFDSSKNVRQSKLISARIHYNFTKSKKLRKNTYNADNSLYLTISVNENMLILIIIYPMFGISSPRLDGKTHVNGFSEYVIEQNTLYYGYR